jgi:altronate dehydratase
MNIDELTVGTICGGSDAASGLTANRRWVWRSTS